MTAQVADSVVYEDVDYSLCGVNGEGLFAPASLGLKPFMSSTACWRGFVCTYAVEDGALVLDDLSINLPHDADVTGPVIFGAHPSAVHVGQRIYEGMNAPIEFSGGLLIGDEFIRELYV